MLFPSESDTIPEIGKIMNHTLRSWLTGHMIAIHTIALGKEPGVKFCPGRSTGGGGDEHVIKANAFFRQAVDVRSGVGIA